MKIGQYQWAMIENNDLQNMKKLPYTSSCVLSIVPILQESGATWRYFSRCGRLISGSLQRGKIQHRCRLQGEMFQGSWFALFLFFYA